MGMRQSLRDFLHRSPRLDGLFRRHIWSRIHFPEMEMRFLASLPPNVIDVAVDVGAALGPYSWILNRKARAVFAFEPGQVHGDYLACNVGGTRVTLVRAAVGDHNAVVKMYTPGHNTDAFHTATVNASNPVASQEGVIVREVPQIVLDEFFADKLAGRRVDLIKIDVEGHENAVLIGAKSLLEAHRPMVICEVEARHNPEYMKSFDLLRGLSYACLVYDRGRYKAFDGNDISSMQSASALHERLTGSHDPAENRYLNNFVFQHPSSRIKVPQ